MFINHALNEIQFKIVYYGPGLSGKTTNLIYIHNNLDKSLKSDLIKIETREERTLFFDFMQMELGSIQGKKPKFNLYTIPGQVYYSISRKLILNGADGIIFVADSQRERMDENLETLYDLELNLIDSGETLQTFPWVLQYNKRDLPNCASIDTLESRLNFLRVPYFTSVAHKGIGVIPTLKAIINQVVKRILVSAE
ncbi:GTPase domain-containing protein [candidate division KSB1 bacterium]|nr:GTPase domain-containing protein [candidate division KSB1 bacterium]